MSRFSKQPTAVEIWHHGGWCPAVVLGRRLEDTYDCVVLVRITMPDQAEVSWVRQADLRIPPREATPGVAGDTWSRSDAGAAPGRHRAWEDSLTGGHIGEARTARLPLRLMPVPAAQRDLSAPDRVARAGEPGGSLAAKPTEEFGRGDASGPQFPPAVRAGRGTPGRS